MQAVADNKKELKIKADVLYTVIQKLYSEVNSENKVPRNSRCWCGSGKKWKKCCLIKHEEKTLELEKMIKDYKGMCIELRKKK